ncbi:MAG TPA: prolipoprotein diacylglyceryl transferase family protein [Gemmatimonadales bacterium]
MTPSDVVARALYGLLFAAVLPLGLAAWAAALAPIVPLPAVRWPVAGAAVVAGGVILMALGMADLVRHGKGLPMNAFPPPVFVRTGIYRWLRNPIYVGFGLVAAGAALVTGSAAGLWVVTPITVLAMLALVWGYERHDLLKRFGPAALEPVLTSLPAAPPPARPSASHRVAVYLWVFVPWLVAYFSVQALGPAPDAFRLEFPIEARWPVLQWTEALYVSAYLFVPTAPLLARTTAGLRRFAVAGVAGTIIVTLLWLILPVIATNRPFEPTMVLGRLLAWEQGSSRGVAAFPAFHVLWPLLVADLWTDNARASGKPWWAVAGWAFAIAIALSTLTTGMHTVPDVLAAVALYWPLRRPEATWEAVRAATERLANSWREWRIGPVRIINYGVYAAAAAGAGLLIAGMALGERSWAVIWVGFCVLAGAGLWAQWLEGSSKLLRPFGWYGGVLGGVLGAVTAGLAGVPIVPLLAAFACAAPFIQIFGRLRCLVNGCCHGGPAPEAIGIRCIHRRSRVTALAHLAGIPIHPTPLYSILGNVVIGLLLLRFRALGAADGLILGLYLILSGIARFVEESYRAEPQTKMIAGLHIYQWLAIAQVVAGILCTLLPAVSRVPGFATPTPLLLAGALIMAALTGFAMGVDFPGSNRRYSRLAEAD